MNNFNRVFLAVLLGMVAILLSASTVMAGTGGRNQSQNLEYVYNTTWTLSANVSYTIRATAVGTVDPILHVQSRPSGDYLAGNDDCTGGSFSSCVTIPAVGNARNVWIVVRAYSASTEGTATFQIIPSVGSTYTTTIPVQASKVFTNLSSYRLGSHFFTVEEQGGANATIIMALSGNRANGIAYDDSDGVGLMSWIHTPAACAQNCWIFVAKRSTSGGGLATYVWDEDMHIAGGDSDGDGASNVLEAALTTDPNLVDTDEDGLGDMAEVMGVDTPDDLLRLPLYGANPKLPDVFVQADWLKCDTTLGHYCGPGPFPGDQDWFRFEADHSTLLREKYQDPLSDNQIATHIDNGRVNIDPATRTDSGAWAGAIRHTTWTGNKCEWRNPTREGYFHFARVFARGGQAPWGGHTCLDASNSEHGGTFAHELGHNFNLFETGIQSGDTEAFCKPNYRSLMNYAVLSETHNFSSGQFLSVPLNPSEMDEQSGLGTVDATLLDYITGGTFQYMTSPTGQIDWNRNGKFDGGLVRAAATWADTSCRVGGYQADQEVWEGRAGSALAWLPTESGDRLYWFTRNETTNYIEYRYATSFPEDCGTPPRTDCKTTWVPALSQSASVLSSSVASGPPAVARYWDTSNSVYKLALVYPDANNLLRSRIFTPTGHGYWSTPVSLPGSITIQGDAAAATYGDRAYVYASAASGSTLYKWSLSNAGAWTGPATQVWLTGGSVLAKYGIGVTSGQDRQGAVSTTRMFAAIPLAAPLGNLRFAWNIPSTSNTWTAFPDADWVNGIPTTTAQPGLAYAPMNPNDTAGPGRFYVAWTPPDDAGGEVPMNMAMTEGNDTASLSNQQLRWEPVRTRLESDWSMGRANISLHYDLAFDRNVRAAFTMEYGAPPYYRALTFEPFADGLFDNVISDQDDYIVLKENLNDWGIHE